MAVFSGKPSSTGDFCRQPRTTIDSFLPAYGTVHYALCVRACVSYILGS